MHEQKSQCAGQHRLAGQKKRVTVLEENGLTIYCAPAWPGWRDILNTISGLVIVSVILAVFLLFSHLLGRFFGDFFSSAWLNKIIYFIFAGSFDLSLVVILVLLLFWMPYFLIYQVSPKQVCIVNNSLHHTVRLFGIVPRTRKIPFERIMEIKIAPSGSLYHLKAVYEMKLPKWLYIILTYWNEKFSQWPLTLINAFPTKQEAEWLQDRLLEPMTKSK
jgi:hypothetical protein